jgi:rhamnogalacturonyl hydrolase YesR
MNAMNPFSADIRQRLPGLGRLISRCWACILLAATISPGWGGESPGLPSPAEVTAKMVAVASWQEAHPSRWPELDWTRAPYYLGLLATTRTTGDEQWADAVREIGRKNDWRLGGKPFFADDHAVGQAWLALYVRDRLPEQRAAVEAGIKAFADRPVEPSLEWKNKIHDREWAWCDALFMSPQVLAGMTTVSGDRAWLDKMDERYWHTCDYLFDAKERLFMRDSGFFDKREANGAKVFWSRGNGWVFAGLVHILQQMPVDHPTRPKYLDLFRSLAKRLIELQQPDGSWHASLLDPASFSAPESSGTAFFCYGLLWGVNQDLLEGDDARPAGLRAWRILASHVQPDGMLGYVQPCGVSPRKINPTMTEVYGSGGFLLAASELHNMILLEDARAASFQLGNPNQRNRLREVTIIPWLKIAGLLPDPVAARIGVRDLQTGEFVASQISDEDSDGKPDGLLCVATVLPGQTRDFELVECKQPLALASVKALRYIASPEPLVFKSLSTTSE